MTIEIHQPELEALIQQRIDSGAFQSVEDMLLHALKSLPATVRLPKSTLPDFLNTPPSNGVTGARLVEVCAMVQGLTDDVDFSRNPSAGRPIDLS